MVHSKVCIAYNEARYPVEQDKHHGGIFKKYLTETFIETGSAQGDGIKAALAAGFNKIYSIEVQPALYQHCKTQFDSDPRVTLAFGDSGVQLGNILTNVNEQCFFWLDGHYSGGNTGHSGKETPLLDELEHISKHGISTHTIAVDDTRDWRNSSRRDTVNGIPLGFDIDTIKDKILSINSSYQFTYETKLRKFPNDVLVAYI